MADAADLASIETDLFNRVALGSHTSNLEKPGTTVCIECDDEIPEERRRKAPWARHCVECLSFIEQKKRLFRKH